MRTAGERRRRRLAEGADARFDLGGQRSEFGGAAGRRELSRSSDGSREPPERNSAPIRLPWQHPQAAPVLFVAFAHSIQIPRTKSDAFKYL